MLAAATILGSGGFIPTGTRETSSLLLLAEAAIARWSSTRARACGGLSPTARCWPAHRLEVLLTHFHIDHVCGLAYLTELDDLEIVVRGPGAALYDVPTAECWRGSSRRRSCR